MSIGGICEPGIGHTFNPSNEARMGQRGAPPVPLFSSVKFFDLKIFEQEHAERANWRIFNPIIGLCMNSTFDVHGVLPFDVVEDLLAEGLPSVVGVLGVEDTGLQDAGCSLMAKEGVLQALAAFRAFP